MTTPKNDLGSLANEFRGALEVRLSGETGGDYLLASKKGVSEFCRLYLEALFPLYYSRVPLSPLLKDHGDDLESKLAEQVGRAMYFDHSCRGVETPGNLLGTAQEVVAAIRGRLPHLAQLLATDLQAA